MALSTTFVNKGSASGRFGTSYGKASTSTSRSKAAPKPLLDIPALQETSRLVQEQLIKDAQIIPDIGDMLTIPGGQSSASYTVFQGDFRTPFQKRKHVGIPPALWEHFQSPEMSCHMGIFPEIERVWISLDHKLFLWDYVEGLGLSSFVEQSDTISHVALVKPKANVFIDEISYLLVICTPITVILLGLSSQPSTGPEYRQHKDIKVYATDIVVPTDGVPMISVTSTADGRIFMCGETDGCIYELHYQEKEVWFGKRFHLVNHSASATPSFIPLFRTSQNEERLVSLTADQARNCIYSLSEYDWISVWKPEPNKGLRKIQTLSNLHKQVQDKAPGAPALLQGLRLLSLHVIDQRESKAGVQLMALSNTGVRLYFSQTTGGYGGYNYGVPYGGTDMRQLHLVHVRLPPMNLYHPDEQCRARQSSTNIRVKLPQTSPAPSHCIIKDLCFASYIDGILVASQPGDADGKDFLIGISPDLSKIGSLGRVHGPSGTQIPSQSFYPSAPSSGYLPSSVASRTPLTEQATMLYLEGIVCSIAAIKPNVPSAGALPPVPTEPLSTNELATQVSQPHHEFLVLSNVGISHLVKRRILDYLRDALEEAHAEGNWQPLMDFRDSFGRDQTCAMLLALASGNTFLAIDRNRYALYEEVGTIGPDTATIAKQAFYDLADRPLWVERGYVGDVHGNIIFSGRREGLALYFARLVRAIWRAKIVVAGASGCTSNFQEKTLVTIHKNLQALRNLLDNNPQLFASAPGDQVGTGNRQEHDAWKIEAASVAQLQALLSRTVEAISFVLLLMDYHLADLVAQCDKDIQAMLSAMNYEDLVASESGLHVSRTLVNVIINSQIGQQISIDAVSDVLQQRCGSFCGADDVMLYKAQEAVRKAADIHDSNERQVFLEESIRLFTRAARVIEFDKLQEICSDYQRLNYAKGAVKLPLQCAIILDDDNLGLDYWHSGMPPNDSCSQLLEKRKKCYELVLNYLSILEEQRTKNPTREAEVFGDTLSCAYTIAFASEDPIFHSHLYDWMVKQGISDYLLESRPPFLEADLLREPASAGKYQLLWQLYVKNGQYLRAAEVLAALARSSEFDLTLEIRLELLTLAVSNAKSHPVSVNGKHETAIAFLSELEDQLEVAQVQMELLHALLPRIDEPGEVGRKIQVLQRRLFDVTELYQLYADPFGLPGIKLLILHVSGHEDEAVVKPTWNAIFDQATSTGTVHEQADRIFSAVVTHGRRFYPSESAFPLHYITTLLMRFSLANKGARPVGWVPRILKECGVPYSEIWDILHDMYESQVPPFNMQENIQALSSDVAVLLKDWVEDTRCPSSAHSAGNIPIDLLDRTIAKYLQEVAPDRKETKAIFEDVKRQLRRHW